MFKSTLLMGLLAVPPMCLAQDHTYGPLEASGTNEDGYPIFLLKCDRYHCVGLKGRDMKTPEYVARYMPAISAQKIDQLNYDCRVICRDRSGRIVGSPSPNYRNPYVKGSPP